MFVIIILLNEYTDSLLFLVANAIGWGPFKSMYR